VSFSAEELRAISEELAERFPLPVEETRLVLMDVDPHRVHAYWNITSPDLAAARTAAGPTGAEAPLVLRFHDLSPTFPGGKSAHESFDIEVQGLESHWHEDLLNDAKSYITELGLRLPDGRLALLARSNRIQMPRASESGGFPGELPKVTVETVEAGIPVHVVPPPLSAAQAAPLPATPGSLLAFPW
jgi:hypothetical protein